MAVHIGKEIEKKYKESGMKLSEFAKRLNTSPRNVYSIFVRNEIKTDQLLKIGEILSFNFFDLFIRENDGRVSEPSDVYGKTPSEKIVVMVELDGKETTLNKWIDRLTAINNTI
jgi:hypothetical protein